MTRNQRLRARLRWVGIWALVVSARLAAQPVGVVDNPCPMPFVPSAALQKLVTALLVEPHTITPEELEAFNNSPELAEVAKANRQRAEDWPGLCRFRAANAAVLAAPTRPRVVFMGDSITENWALADPAFFRGEIVNRGISGQTTPQMLVRFRADVVALAPKIVHLMAGTNDVAGNTGLYSLPDSTVNSISCISQKWCSSFSAISCNSE